MPDPHEMPDPHVRVRVWDIPTRLFHWLIVVLFAISWWTAETDRLDWHILSGYGILTLVLFRIYWGIAGSGTARFAAFVKRPGIVIDYAKHLFERSGPPALGHNPMGGWSVVALIFLLLLQVALGLFATDLDGINAGPLDTLVSFKTGRWFSHQHGRVFNILLALSALHVAAILFYWAYKRENLIAAMISGVKRVPAHRPLHFARLWWTIPGLLIAGLLVAWLALGRF
jgi:cytochrome b